MELMNLLKFSLAEIVYSSKVIVKPGVSIRCREYLENCFIRA